MLNVSIISKIFIKHDNKANYHHEYRSNRVLLNEVMNELQVSMDVVLFKNMDYAAKIISIIDGMVKNLVF